MLKQLSVQEEIVVFVIVDNKPEGAIALVNQICESSNEGILISLSTGLGDIKAQILKVKQ